MKLYTPFEEVPTMDIAAARYGFKEKGYKLLTYDSIEEVPTSEHIIVVGYIDELQSYFERIGIGKQKAINIPEQLSGYEFLQRDMLILPMKSIRALKLLPSFVKPYTYPKEFMAGVITKESSFEFFKGVPDETMVLQSEVVDMVSEYRCYICKRKLLGIKHYQGDIKIFPNISTIEKMIATYTKAPSGYSLDVAILNTGETVLVEVQDGWALGNYGLDCELYTQLLASRWYELINKRNETIFY